MKWKRSAVLKVFFCSWLIIGEKELPHVFAQGDLCERVALAEGLKPNVDYVADQIEILLHDENGGVGRALYEASQNGSTTSGIADLDSVGTYWGLKQIKPSFPSPQRKFLLIFPEGSDVGAILQSYCHFPFIRALGVNIIYSTSTSIKMTSWSHVKTER